MPDKYKDEIEEILRKAGEVAPSDPPRELARIDDEEWEAKMEEDQEERRD